MQLGQELENRNIDLKPMQTAAGAAASVSFQVGKGTVAAADIGVLDSMDGPESADGFVGAAGSAVGVEAGETDEAAGDEPIRMKGRSHIKRR